MSDKRNIEKRFKQLLVKFQSGDFTASELEELQQLVKNELAVSVIEEAMYSELEVQDFSEYPTFDKGELFQSIEHQLDVVLPGSASSGHKLQLFALLVRVAAVLILVFAVSGLTAYFINERHSVEKQLISSSEIVAPQGAMTQVILPDSSVVWLNAGSRLTYSTNFNLDNRLVHLEGEGYFQVAKNNELPFVVDAYGFLVEGGQTEFNVKAYRDEPTIEAILVEGKVWLNHRTETIASDVSLGRKYKATFYKQSDGAASSNRQPRLVISPNVDPKPLISWKNDQFIHQKSEVLDKLLIQRGNDLVILYDLHDKHLIRADQMIGIERLNLNLI
ncbi:FecR family protein [Gaoshiqia sediminis]|uniref:FecR family protein n=1 Tax=Gaoshiqia sediminis TaxID=2986998 RepID=A0AA41YAP3_9BACT|nr:FecR family protein [Gaoshiqia sediminis]MCW0484492.1 FecR family protein [Gaoshiqia sediminis]